VVSFLEDIVHQRVLGRDGIMHIRRRISQKSGKCIVALVIANTCIVD
jgi:hypothetical protein